MNEQNDLKPCPHCGRQVQYSIDIEGIPQGIYCARCHMIVKYTNLKCGKRDKFGKVMGEIAERWNSRKQVGI